MISFINLTRPPPTCGRATRERRGGQTDSVAMDEDMSTINVLLTPIKRLNGCCANGNVNCITAMPVFAYETIITVARLRLNSALDCVVAVVVLAGTGGEWHQHQLAWQCGALQPNPAHCHN